MSIQIGDNFKYQGKKPLDGRILYSTLADMVAMPEASLYEGCKAYVTATGKEYRYKASNTVDSTLGKWREETGGGVSDFDDLTNRPLESDTIDIDELDLPMPAKPTEYPILFDETGTEYQVGWYKRASDGKVKPIWRKDILWTSSMSTGRWTYITHGITNIDKIIDVVCLYKDTTANEFLLAGGYRDENVHSMAAVGTTYVYVYNGSSYGKTLNGGATVKVQYTKTTDEWKEV